MPPDSDNDVYDFREGFDTRLIDMNRTCKVTKVFDKSVLSAVLSLFSCGNYNGVIGFTKAKGPAVPVALQKLAEWEFVVSQHSAVPQGVLDIIQSMPHDAHPMGVLVNSISALSIFHPDANPALRISNKNCWQVRSSPQSVSSVDEPDQAKMKSELDHLTIPNDGTYVWEIDPKHLKYGTQIASGSYGELQEVAIKVLKAEHVNSELQRVCAGDSASQNLILKFILSVDHAKSLLIKMA
ncbi:hypothetical protein Fmac_018138 [Flemingia macrophylla]|uniref:Uncharacterized protein n=1 Tax=Flemingia macrophylla TaxID=520843 RepID=A0ABD1M4J1_9FABA